MGHIDDAADALGNAATLLGTAFPHLTHTGISFDDTLYALSLYYQAVVDASNKAEQAGNAGEAYRLRVARHHQIKTLVREIGDIVVTAMQKAEGLAPLTTAYKDQLTEDAASIRAQGGS